ncbi:MAG TPA: S9 family peptidase [Ktedonobacterales bacterium]|nr:S9 family peptidase [Ktedonobacterales bacterium]
MSQPTASPSNDDLPRYLNVRRAHAPAWSPDGARLAFVADTSGLDQAWTIALDCDSAPVQLTHFDERVGEVSWSPDGASLLVSVDAGGNEHDQLYLVPAGGGTPRALTSEPHVIHHFGAWSPDGQRICYSCNRRHPAAFDVWLMELATGDSRCVMQADATLTPRAWSPDGQFLVVSRENTNLDDDLFLVPLDGAAPRLLTAHEGEAAYIAPRFAPDSHTLYVLTNRDRELLAPAALDLAAAILPDAHVPLTILADAPWEADASLALSPDGDTLAWSLNEDGSSRLVFYDLRVRRELPAPALPSGVVEGLTWSPAGGHVAFGFNGTRHNGNLWTAAPGATSARQLTRVPMGGLDPATLVEPELVRYTSFDGLEIPAFYYRPTSSARASAAGLPVIVFVHGGPESQFRPLHAAPWMPPLQYYLSRGFAVFAPNVRGSSGYGKTAIHRDDVRLRPNSVADLKAGVAWLIAHGGADPQRIGIMGRSYGGFMVLAAITSYPDLWAAAADMVGIANFFSFFEQTGVWRRHLRTPEYGDPERDADFLRELSPLFKADNITTPLLVLHGANDPRVPVNEAQQIVAAVRARGKPAELLLFPDEGHFMLRQSTQLTAYPAIGDWFERYMG